MASERPKDTDAAGAGLRGDQASEIRSRRRGGSQPERPLRGKDRRPVVKDSQATKHPGTKMLQGSAINEATQTEGSQSEMKTPGAREKRFQPSSQLG